MRVQQDAVAISIQFARSIAHGFVVGTQDTCTARCDGYLFSIRPWHHSCLSCWYTRCMCGGSLCCWFTDAQTVIFLQFQSNTLWIYRRLTVHHDGWGMALSLFDGNFCPLRIFFLSTLRGAHWGFHCEAPKHWCTSVDYLGFSSFSVGSSLFSFVEVNWSMSFQ